MILLTSCKTSVPSSNVIKEDLVDQKIYLYNGEITILDSKNIEYIDIVKKDINRQNRYYLATVNIKLKNKDITLVGTGNIEYRYIPNEGWIIQDIKMDDETVNIEYNKELNTNTLNSILANVKLEYQSQGDLAYWEINDLNKITNFKLLDIVETDNGFSNKIKMAIISKNSSEEFEADINLNLTYSLYDYSWNVNSIEVIKVNRRLYAGVSEDILKNLLSDIKLFDIMEINFNNDTIKYSWNISEYDEIKSLDILAQSTKLKEYKDNIKARITLEKNNLKLSNNMMIDCIYGSEGWEINNISIPKAINDYTLLNEPNISLENLSKDLVGESFYYEGYILGEMWTIEEGELQTANIVEKLPKDYGNSIGYLVNIELRGSDTTINGDVIITYEYDKNNDTWELKELKTVNDFEAKSNNEL